MKVSVIVPVYNVEKYVRQCILSLLSQTLEDIEIIIVNDGSTDKSIINIQDLIEENENIKLINKINGGLSSARNTGLNVAKGEYISFIDSDDYVEDNFLELLYNDGKRYDLDVVFSSYSKLYEDKSLHPQKRNSKLLTDKAISGNEFLINQIGLNEYKMEVCDDLYKRKFLLDNKIRFWEDILFEDEEFTLSILLNAKRVKLIDSSGYIYRQRRSSIMNCDVTYKHLDSLLLLVNKFVDIYNQTHNTRLKVCIYKIICNILWSYLESIDNSTYRNDKLFYLKIKQDNILKILKENTYGRNDNIKFIIFSTSPKLYWKILMIREKFISNGFVKTNKNNNIELLLESKSF